MSNLIELNGREIECAWRSDGKIIIDNSHNDKLHTYLLKVETEAGHIFRYFIVMINEHGNEVARYNYEHCFGVEWTKPIGDK